MKNILIINGHQKYRPEGGRLNQTLADSMVRLLSEKFEVQTTVIQNGYDVEEERAKFMRADVVIYQTPIYWFSVPGLFKTYMDELYAYGTFYQGADVYGQGGLLTGKQYMLSTTWNAPETAFNDPSQFFEGAGLEEALSALHRIQKFLGMKPLKSFACYDVVKHPKVEEYISGLEQHLKKELNF